jgi:hypothetical protein
MAAAYTLANAVTQICAKVKDYDERRYGVNDSKSYFRAKHLFWEAVNKLISPTEEMKRAYPDLYAYAVNLDPKDIFGLVKSTTEAFASGKITLTDITGFMKLLRYFNYKTTSGIAKKVRYVSPEKFNGMAGAEIYPDNTIYITEFGNVLYVTPEAETGKLTIAYIETPDNQLATATSLLATFSLSFITNAVKLAGILLKEEIYENNQSN